MELKNGKTAVIDHEIDQRQAMELCEKQQVFYGATTCWWTASAFDLYKEPDSGLPCDPRGGMLMQTGPIDGAEFVRNALANPGHYGKHGLRAFLLAYHGCVKVKESGYPTCFRTWDEYNQLIDEKLIDGGADA